MGDKYEIDLEMIAEIVNRVGVPCYVEQTGGGTATIYAGGTWHWDEDDTDRQKAVAGPGWFEGPGFTKGRGSLYDFSIGPDCDGEGDYTTPACVGAFTEQDIAKLIIAQASKEPHTAGLSFDELEALGFDGTYRSMPPDMIAQNARTDVGINAHNRENKRLAELGVPVMERRIYTEEAARRALFDYDHPPITERRGDPAP